MLLYLVPLIETILQNFYFFNEYSISIQDSIARPYTSSYRVGYFFFQDQIFLFVQILLLKFEKRIFYGPIFHNREQIFGV